MCCGSRRSALRSASALLKAPPAVPVVPQGAFNRARMAGALGQNPAATTEAIPARQLFPSVNLRYMESSPIRVRGPMTGRQYDFSVAQPTEDVDLRDAAVLTRSALFRRV